MFKQPEVPTQDVLVGWLRTQPADETYVWQDPTHCLVGQFLADQGRSWGEFGYSDIPGYEEIAAPKPWTFGAALQRAEALKALPAPVPAMIEHQPEKQAA